MSGLLSFEGAAYAGGKPDIFDRVWRLNSSVTKCKIKEIDAFIRSHYLGKRPAIVLCALAMESFGELSGCVIFSSPPREASVRYGGETWELSRLYIRDDVPRNAESWLIAKAIKYVKHAHPKVMFLLSYADPSAGHCGTIYKAGNWQQDGRTDDERKTARCDYYDARTGKKYGRKGNMPAGAVVERRPRVSKWRFVYKMQGRS